jgi:hypothetical protein
MNRIRPEVDIVLQLLQTVLEAKPHSAFTASLLAQYQERGGLSKKQLQGLYDKASGVEGISVAKLATLEAIIMKKHTKHRSPVPAATPLYTKDEVAGQLIDALLAKFPAHKRVLFIKAKYDNNEVLIPAEIAELKKFHQLLIDRK